MSDKITDQRDNCHRDLKVFVSLKELVKINVHYFYVNIFKIFYKLVLQFAICVFFPILKIFDVEFFREFINLF